MTAQQAQHSRSQAPPANGRSGIVWIASFPKSGNTWTRTFLHNLTRIMRGEQDAQDINAMGRFSTWEIQRSRYAEVLGFEPGNEHRKEIAGARHEVQRRIADAHDGLVFIKTHHALVTDRGSTTINTSVTSGAIYVVRNPLDVVISYAAHMNCSIDNAIVSMAEENLETNVSDDVVYEVYGSWSQHVWTWTRNPHPAILVMRYEDLHADPRKTFGGLAKHLLLDADPAQIDKAIEWSSFERLREQEEQAGFREKPKAAERFFREGKVAQWESVLSKTQIDRVIENHHQQMKRFGYLK